MNTTKEKAHISSDTNDPSTAHMRVFVGNINTSLIDKPTLQDIFRKYGYVTGISIHRGYAFVQYNSVMSARKAAQMENGSMITDQIADVNIAAEPKPNQKPSVGGVPMGMMENSYMPMQQPNLYPPIMNMMPGLPMPRPPGGVMKVSKMGVKKSNGQIRTNKVHSGRVAKQNSNVNKSAMKSNAKTLVSSVVNLSAVRKELVEIRDKINALLFIINKSGGVGIDQNISFDITDHSTNGETATTSTTTATTEVKTEANTDETPAVEVEGEATEEESANIEENTEETTPLEGEGEQQQEEEAMEEFVEEDIGDMSTVEVEVGSNHDEVDEDESSNPQI